jgi:hypothetical protein
MENIVQPGGDHRRLFLTALSVLTQVMNKREPPTADVQLLKANALPDELDLDLDELAGSIVRRETAFRAAERKLA